MSVYALRERVSPRGCRYVLLKEAAETGVPCLGLVAPKAYSNGALGKKEKAKDWEERKDERRFLHKKCLFMLPFFRKN